MQVETPETSRGCDEMSDLGPTSVENIFEGEFNPPQVPVKHHDESPADSNWWAGSSNGNHLPAESESFGEPTDELVRVLDDPEPIVYELAPEADEEISELAPHVEDKPMQAQFMIPEPASNPFDASPVADEADRFKTVVSIELDEEMRAAVENYDPAPEVVEEPASAAMPSMCRST